MRTRTRYVKAIIFLMAITMVFSGMSSQNAYAAAYATMKVHYIDVGESDCTLIESDGRFMLIDAGDTDDSKTIKSFLDKRKVKKLDFLILTHPHADHIGAAADIIDGYEIGKLIMPEKEHTTKTFEKVLDTIEKKKLKITKPVVGKQYEIGKGTFTILAPNDSYGDNLNDWSIALRLVNGKNSFLFIGDCEKDAISDILNNKETLKSDVYMCGHHGSDTSTTKSLIKAVKPKKAVISVGKNSYGHPKDSVLKMLSDNKIDTYRTDKGGTIIATSNGTKITFNVNESVYKDAKKEETKKPVDNTPPVKKEEPKTAQVYVTKTGSKYHASGCRYLSQSKISISLKDAKVKYTPCSVCNPPK